MKEIKSVIENFDLKGSLWRRWDPHLHTPGTILNDQFSDTDQGWEDWIARIENASPKVECLGVTDYCVLDNYEKVLNLKNGGRLDGVLLIFPNIELRLGIGVGKLAAVNFHILISPEDPEHVQETKSFLQGLTFQAFDNTYRCTKEDLIKLGKEYTKSKGKTVSNETALREGVNQFKVNLDQFRSIWKGSAWIQKNALIAVAGGSKDGTAGLAVEPSQTTLREEIESIAHIVFSGQPNQRNFWLGKGSLDRSQLESRYKGRKPCLHGSDAHQLDKVAIPDGNRLCWIKGDPTFETLKQACIEPMRAFVGDVPPEDSSPSQTITSVEVDNATWLKTPKIALNPGLVCIIGARGSGKTALADLIATGAYSAAPHLNERSFIKRAQVDNLLGNSTVALVWQDNQKTQNQISNYDSEDLFDKARVQYLSQQFVDRLCSADGLTSELLNEIERVIFEAHGREDRLGASDFRELLERQASRSRDARIQSEEELGILSEEINTEIEKKALLPELKKQHKALSATTERQKKDRSSLTVKGNEKLSLELETVTKYVEVLQSKIDQAQRAKQSLLSLSDAVRLFQEKTGPRYLEKYKEKFSESGLVDDEWEAFSINFTGDVESIIKKKVEAIDSSLLKLQGVVPSEPSTEQQPVLSFISVGERVEDQSLAILQLEMKRIQGLVGLDQERSRKVKYLTTAITRNETILHKLNEQILVGEKSAERIEVLRANRKTTHKEVFKAILDEELELKKLYAPLQVRLQGESGALGKLTFEVRRTADVERWAESGERLLDLRKNGPFKGKGALLGAAKSILRPHWERGTAEEIADAMTTFLEKNERGLKEHSPIESQQSTEYRHWANSVSQWLYQTDHIQIAYGVQYDGIDIEQLSPGTRGIVLLLLYLTIDQEDLRPLIIDQPEENLDPKSIFDELVDRFQVAKQRRQIIIVTHNANLVVNTDADQVIVATSGPHQKGGLPDITYESGGLENPKIRQKVCEILEGGEAAFKDRARRLRVRLSD